MHIQKYQSQRKFIFAQLVINFADFMTFIKFHWQKNKKYIYEQKNLLI